MVVLILANHLGGEECGYKYFKNYRANEYDNSPQNRCIVQDKCGIIYVGNQGGLLEFDGFSWRAHEIPNQSVYSLTIDESNTLYIGGINEIGFMAPDTKGNLHYNSLKKHLRDKEKSFGIVWATYGTKKGVYFQTASHLFRWHRGKLEIWWPELGFRFNTSFTCNEKFYVHQRRLGLMQMVEDSLELLPGCELVKEAKIYMMTPFDGRKLLLGTRSKGFFLFDDSTGPGFNIVCNNLPGL